MVTFKLFSDQSNIELEKQVNTYIFNNPAMVPISMQMCRNTQGTTFVGILFDEVLPLPKMDPMPAYTTEPWVPAPLREITCDDPWKGEFYPIGDPPESRPKRVTAFGARAHGQSIQMPS